jgi:hypothetical protein
VGSQVGCGGVPNVVVFHDDIGVLYGFSADSPANEPVNSLLFFNKMRQNCPFYSKKKKLMQQSNPT